VHDLILRSLMPAGAHVDSSSVSGLFNTINHALQGEMRFSAHHSACLFHPCLWVSPWVSVGLGAKSNPVKAGLKCSTNFLISDCPGTHLNPEHHAQVLTSLNEVSVVTCCLRGQELLPPRELVG
jgi:hypothetical protein